MLGQLTLPYSHGFQSALTSSSTPDSPSVDTAPDASGDYQLPSFFEANAGQLPDGVKFMAHSGGAIVYLSDTGARIDLPDATVGMSFARASPDARVVGTAPLATKINYLVGPQSEWATQVSTFRSTRYESIYPGIDALFYARADHLQYDFTVAPGADPADIAVKLDGAQSLRLDASGDLLVNTGTGILRHNAPVAYQRIGGEVRQVTSSFVLHGNQVGFRLGAYDTTKTLVIDPDVVYSTFLGGDEEERITGLTVDVSGNAYIWGHTSSEEDGDSGLTTTASAGPVYDDDYSGGTDDDGDSFLAKFGPDGTPVFVTYLGGSGTDAVPALPNIPDTIGVDVTGEAVVIGATSSENFPIWPTSTAYDRTCTDCDNSGGVDGDAFITKFTADGTGLVYSTYLGGAVDDAALTVDVDPAGNAFVAGVTNSTENHRVVDQPQTGTAIDGFPLSDNAWDATYSTSSTSQACDDGDSWVAGFDPDGTNKYVTYFGGGQCSDEEGGDDIPIDIATDGNGNAFVGGRTRSTNITTTAGVLDPEADDSNEGWLAGYDPDGDQLYATYLGGGECAENDFGDGDVDNDPCDDTVRAVEADSHGNAYVAGFTASRDFPLEDPFDRECPTEDADLSDDAGESAPDGFIAKMALDGSPIYSSCLGGDEIEELYDLAVDPDGFAFVTGWTKSDEFQLRNPFDGDESPTKQPTPEKARRGPNEDVSASPEGFATSVDPNGNLVYSTYLGGSGPEFGHSVSVDQFGNAYYSGYTAYENEDLMTVEYYPTATAFPTTNDSLARGDEGDAYVVNLDCRGEVIFSTYVGGAGPQGEFTYVGNDVTGNAFIAGQIGPPGSDGESVGEPRRRVPDFPLSENAYDKEMTRADDDDASDEVYLTKLEGESESCSRGGGGGGGGGNNEPTPNPSNPAPPPEPVLDLTPERANNTLPGDDKHTVKASVNPSRSGAVIDFEIVAGPNVRNNDKADFTCTTGADGSCSVEYQSRGDRGTDMICGWMDDDGDETYDAAGSEEDGGECDSEGPDDPDLNGTDTVLKTWEKEAEAPAPGPRICDTDKFKSYNIVLGTPGDDRLVGTPGKDLICSKAGDDVIKGFGGDDVIFMGEGRDLADGGGGGDTIHGARGKDRIEGDRGKDAMWGGRGDDSMHGGRAADLLFAQRGDDDLAGGPGPDALHGGPGTDSCAGGGDLTSGCES